MTESPGFADQARSQPHAAPPDVARKHILTVSTEEFFHGGALEDVVLRKHWERFESRLAQNLETVLETLGRFDQRATFFVLGWTAERNPELIEKIVEAGHEVASRGYWPRGVKGMMPEEFVEDLERTRRALEAAGGQRVVGFRSPRWFRRDDLWALDVLAEQGYAYDSSINPVLRWFAGMPEFHALREHRLAAGKRLWEVPVSTKSYLGMRVAIGGGNYMRQLPRGILDRAVRAWDRDRSEPLVYYFTTWELDPDQPQITAIGKLNRIRQYRNLGKIGAILEGYLQRYRFTSIADYLGLDLRGELQAAAGPDAPLATIAAPVEPEVRATEVTFVVPMHNEEQNVRYLLKTLDGVEERHRDRIDARVLLVDDGSTDRTAEVARELVATRENAELLVLERNAGIAGAMMAGIRAAETEFICSVDCDCSYDPNDVVHMLPMMLDADMVTASPYHRDGQVLNVPRWRLFLSRTLSRMYGWVLGSDLSTYTSCFRVYRRSKIANLELDHGGFLGVAEMLVRLHRGGGRIVEYPTLLERRLLGESKMRILRTMRGHLGLLWRAWRRRI